MLKKKLGQIRLQRSKEWKYQLKKKNREKEVCEALGWRLSFVVQIKNGTC
jgi:hypothetical protein